MRSIKSSVFLLMLACVLMFISASAVAQNFERIGALATGFPAAMAFRGNYIYVAASGLGLRIIDISDPQHPVLAGSFSGVTSSAQAIGLYENCAVLGCRFGLMTVDVTDPTNPSLLDNYEYTSSWNNYFGDIAVHSGYVYAYVYENYFNGLEILNIFNPANIVVETLIQKSTCGFISFCISDSLIYSYTFSNCLNNLVIYNLIDPINPQEIGATPLLYPSWAIIGGQNTVYFLTQWGFEVVDVSEPSNPTYLCDFNTGSETYNGSYGRFGLCAEGNIVYRIGGDNKLRAFNMNDRSNPRLAGIINSSGAGCVYVRNDTIFMASNDSLLICRLISRSAGTISGVVKDGTNLNPISNAVVRLEPYGLFDTTDVSGFYEFDNLYYFNYTVSFSHSDYFPLSDSNLTIPPGLIRDHDVILQHRPYADIEATSLLTPTWFVEDNQDYSINAKVSNLGTSEQSFTLVCSIFYHDSIIPLSSSTRLVNNLPSGESTTMDMGLTFNQAGDTLFRIELQVVLPGDENTDNNILRVFPHPRSRGSAAFYFGNPDGSPIFAEVGEAFKIDLYCISLQGPSIKGINAGLGANISYIDSFLGGQGYNWTSNWPELFFECSAASDSGWVRDCFTGGTAYWPLVPTSQYPIKIAEYDARVINDSSIMDSTIYCLRLDCQENLFGIFDSENNFYEAFAYFSPVYFMPSYQICDYKLGDINNDNSVGGADVTYGVRYFKGYGPAPSDSCWNNRDLRWLYSAGDVNGNCDFKGSDISRLVAYFKSTALIEYCPFTPPASLLRPKKTGVSPIQR